MNEKVAYPLFSNMGWLKKWLKKDIAIALILAAIIAVPPTDSDSQENTQHAMWLCGNYSKGPHPAGGGFGFRGAHVGVEVSLIGSDNYPSDSVYVIPADLASQMKKSDTLGTKKIDGAFGMDFMLITNPFKNVSFYIEGGPWYQETQFIYREQETGQLWSTKHNYNCELGGGGGVIVRLPTSTFLTFDGIHLAAGYHSIRGITAAIGMTY